MKIRPLGDRILVKFVKEDEKTVSGIVLPDTVNKEKKAQGEVLAIGNGEKVAKLDLKVGAKVLFKKWGGEEIEMNVEMNKEYGTRDDEYKILNHDDVLAVLE